MSLGLGEDAIPAVFVIGTAGSGKSTVAKSIASAMGASYLDKDTVANIFTGAMLEANGESPAARDDSEFYTGTIRPLEYSTLLAIGSENLRLGNPIVLDAPFGAYFQQTDYISAIAAEHQWSPHVFPFVVRVSSSEDVTKQRLRSRGLDRDLWKLNNWEQFWSEVGKAHPEWDSVQIVDFTNDADLPGPELASVILQEIEKSLSGKDLVTP